MTQEPDDRPIVYFAAPLFSQSERRWNRQLAERIERRLDCSVILPQDFAAGEHPGDRRHYDALFRHCVDGVAEADVLVAILDGPDADSGTAFEMGYAHARGKPMVGVRTDFREQQDHGTNLMLARACSAIVHLPAFATDIDALAAVICDQLAPLLKPR